MALYYLETSALVKLYVLEPGTERLLRIASDVSENRLAVLALSVVETRSAIRRRERAGDIDSKAAKLILDRFEQHMESRFLRQAVSDVVLDGALEMIDRYALRAYDAIQLAGCLALKATAGSDSPIFVCADQQLIEAARSELLTVLDPGASA
ncbi:MAG TPA: type II toxin-antitoxin system VapC family toxin [Terriglobia bacterium]|nr:type II toxin-antitoxin system VapC family toxin [Terriglobia bacterium]